VVYRRGTDNQAADALSRRDHQLELSAVSSPVHSWLDALQQWYPIDAEAQSLLQQLLVDSFA
jgi:hypothetical protein